MSDMSKEELESLREWLAQWGGSDQANWLDATGETVPIAKTTLLRLIAAAELGLSAK